MNDSGVDGSKQAILVVGANPAWQKSVVCNRWEPGGVVRVQLASTAPAGKGFNTALAIRALGVSVELVSGAGPDRGEWEQECHAHGIDLAVFRLAGPIRTATTIRDLSTGDVTEMVEEGFGADVSADEHLVGLVRQKLSLVRAVVVAGTFPPGMSPKRLLETLATEASVPVVVDSVSVVRALRETDRVPSDLLLKLNEAEWTGVFGEVRLDLALQAARRLWPRADLLATLGGKGALLWDRSGAMHRLSGEPFSPDRLVHPIGAGDAFTAGFVVDFLGGAAVLGACLRGMGVARASCFHPLPARFSLEDVQAESTRVRAETTSV